MLKEINMYRIIKIDASQILEDNLSKEEAYQIFYFLSYEVGMINLTIEEYFPYSHRFGRDPDIH